MQRGWIVVIWTAACGGAEARPTTSPREITRAELKTRADGPPSIAPRLHQRMRIAGQVRVVPDDAVKLAVQTSGQPLVGELEYCVDEAGNVDRVELRQSSGVPSYDERLMAAVNGWRFRPLVVDGRATPVCSAARFIFQIR